VSWTFTSHPSLVLPADALANLKDGKFLSSKVPIYDALFSSGFSKCFVVLFLVLGRLPLAYFIRLKIGFKTPVPIQRLNTVYMGSALNILAHASSVGFQSLVAHRNPLAILPLQVHSPWRRGATNQSFLIWTVKDKPSVAGVLHNLACIFQELSRDEPFPSLRRK
jgi:hypothetical protein